MTAAPPADRAAAPGRHVRFRSGGRLFALALEEVREVLLPPTVQVRAPRAPPTVRGVINLRGRVVTVADFARLLELPEGPLDPAHARVLLLEGATRDLGFLVAEVAGIGALEAFAPPPAGARPEVTAIARSGAEAVTVLGVERLLVTLRAGFAAARGGGPLA